MSSKIRNLLTIKTMKTISMTTPMVIADSRNPNQKFWRFNPL